MDFALIFSRLRPGENVSPLVGNVGVTYAQIAATWRGSGTIPTEQACQDEWTQILVEMPELALTGAAYVAAIARKVAKAMAETDLSASSRIDRAIAVMVLDEVYTPLEDWINAFKAEVAAATSLADLKSRVAGLPTLPGRTKAQMVTFIKNRIDGNE